MAIEVGEGFGIVGDHGVEVESLRSASDPRKFAALQPKIVIQTQIILGRFGYGTKFTGELDSQTREVLRQYQANKGIKKTICQKCAKSSSRFWRRALLRFSLTPWSSKSASGMDRILSVDNRSEAPCIAGSESWPARSYQTARQG